MPKPTGKQRESIAEIELQSEMLRAELEKQRDFYVPAQEELDALEKERLAIAAIMKSLNEQNLQHAREVEELRESIQQDRNAIIQVFQEKARVLQERIQAQAEEAKKAEEAKRSTLTKAEQILSVIERETTLAQGVIQRITLQAADTIKKTEEMVVNREKLKDLRGRFEADCETSESREQSIMELFESARNTSDPLRKAAAASAPELQELSKRVEAERKAVKDTQREIATLRPRSAQLKSLEEQMADVVNGPRSATTAHNKIKRQTSTVDAHAAALSASGMNTIGSTLSGSGPASGSDSIPGHGSAAADASAPPLISPPSSPAKSPQRAAARAARGTGASTPGTPSTSPSASAPAGPSDGEGAAGWPAGGAAGARSDVPPELAARNAELAKVVADLQDGLRFLARILEERKAAAVASAAEAAAAATRAMAAADAEEGAAVADTGRVDVACGSDDAEDGAEDAPVASAAAQTIIDACAADDAVVHEALDEAASATTAAFQQLGQEATPAPAAPAAQAAAPPSKPAAKGKKKK